MLWTGSPKLLGWPTYKAVTGSNLSLVFDAMLFDRSLFNPMFNFLSSLYFLLPAAKKAGRRVGLCNCGVGPITTDLGARMLKKVCDSCDIITVREEGSAEVQHYFDQLGIADACTNFEQFSSERISQFLLTNWNRRQTTREILAREIPLLQKKAMIAADCVAKLDALGG